MARLNVATWRQVRPHVHPDRINVIAVRDLLRDRDRPLRIGADTFTCGELFAGAWTKLSWHLNEGAWLPVGVARRFGADRRAAVRYFAACGASYAGEWFGNPWWEVAITATAKRRPPPRAEDLALALRAPNELADDATDWLLEAHYDEAFSAAIRAWKSERGVKEALGSGFWFPPGVPELPKRLQ